MKSFIKNMNVKYKHSGSGGIKNSKKRFTYYKLNVSFCVNDINFCVVMNNKSDII